MGLTAELTSKLDVSSLGDTLLGSLTSGLGDLDSIDPPADSTELATVGSGAGDIDSSPISGAVSGIIGSTGAITGLLPGADELLGPLTSVLTIAEQIAQGDIATRITTLGERLIAELSRPDTESPIGVLLRAVEALSQAEEGRVLVDLIRPLLASLSRSTGVDLRSGLGSILPVSDGLGALDGVLRTLGGMMGLETILREGQRLTEAMAGALDVDVTRLKLDDLRGILTGQTTGLADFVAGVDETQPGEVAAAIEAVIQVSTRLGRIRESIAAGMGLGEATLIYLDIDGIQTEAGRAATLLRDAAIDPLERLVTRIASGLDPLLAPLSDFDLAGAPARALDQVFDDVEARITDLATDISAIDLPEMIEPLTDGIQFLADAIGRINDVVERVLMSFQAAMETVRQAVAALPFDEIADAVRQVLEPITTVLDTITEFIGRIESTLESAAEATETAVGSIDSALDTFKTEIDRLFASAREAVEAVDLDQIRGVIADKIQDFADLIARADMEPYFDTAVDAIGTAADVVDAVPFGLLPESMKSDVDAAVAPIKAVNAQGFADEVKGILQIGPEGFQLRDDIESAIEDIAVRYQALLKVVEDHHPRKALETVETKLADVARKIRELAPDLALEPVQQAVDQLKGLIEQIDLDAQLQPLRDGFDTIVQTIQQYSPATLIQPIEEQLDTVRDQLVATIKLDEWQPTITELENRAIGLLDFIDPSRLQDQLRQALDELRTLSARLPAFDVAGGIGSLLASALSSMGLRIAPASFEAVAAWLRGDSGNEFLARRAQLITDAVRQTKTAVEALDITVLSAGLDTQVGALSRAVRGLIDRLPGDSRTRAQLIELDVRLDVAGAFGPLVTNRERYLASLTRSASLAEALVRTGFSEVDVALDALRRALAPLTRLWDTLRQLLAGVGLDPQNLSVAGVVGQLLDAVPPERLAGLATPIFTALRERIQALLTAITTPIGDGITELRSLVEAIDLTPLREAMDRVVTELIAEITALHPDQLLAEPLASFNALRAALVDSDPLETINTILTNIRDLAAGVLAKLDLDQLLESPLAIYDHILSELQKLDPRGLLDPVFDQLDTLARQVDEGLDETVDAFERLQDALPSGGGGSSASVSASVS